MIAYNHTSKYLTCDYYFQQYDCSDIHLSFNQSPILTRRKKKVGQRGLLNLVSLFPTRIKTTGGISFRKEKLNVVSALLNIVLLR